MARVNGRIFPCVTAFRSFLLSLAEPLITRKIKLYYSTNTQTAQNTRTLFSDFFVTELPRHFRVRLAVVRPANQVSLGLRVRSAIRYTCDWRSILTTSRQRPAVSE
ncbi:conserved hypothetical protein [Trichinella spiralis]|nr:conserved hypothetical protein [Trichinella spiralis]